MAIPEALHWYTRQAEPVYEMPDAEGKKMVKTTVVQARRANPPLVHGASAVPKLIDKFSLTNHKIESAIQVAIECHDAYDSDKPGNFINNVKELAAARVAETAEIGTEIHKATERAILGYPYESVYEEHVQAILGTLAS